MGDVFFSIWLNEIPSQLNLAIKSLPDAHGNLSFSSTVGFDQLQYNASVLAIRLLESELRSNRSRSDNHPAFSRRRKHRFPSYVKSSNPTDDFIFYTNVLPIDIEQIPFDIKRDFERGTRKQLPKLSTVAFFQSHSTSKAVDNDRETCWRTGRNVRRGDFFAIDFQRIRTNLSFTITVAHSIILQDDLDLNLSYDGLQWITYRSLKGISSTRHAYFFTEEKHSLKFNAAQFTTGFRSFRYIAFNASQVSLMSELKVCDVTIVTEKSR